MINVFQNEKEYTISVTIPIKKIQQYKLGELKQIAKALYWVEDKSDIRKYTFQDLIDVIDEYRELK